MIFQTELLLSREETVNGLIVKTCFTSARLEFLLCNQNQSLAENFGFFLNVNLLKALLLNQNIKTANLIIHDPIQKISYENVLGHMSLFEWPGSGQCSVLLWRSICQKHPSTTTR